MSRLLFLLTFLFCALEAFAQDVRITEFLVSNRAGTRDQDGDTSAWIEIWNPSPVVKVNLVGWKLSDGITQWTFPAVDLVPDGYMIIWASGKNRATPTAPLHTNFTLSPDGGDLSLIRSNGAVSSSFLAYPAQQVDVSYGRDGVNPTLTGFYTKPTPGEANNYSGSGVSGKVLISEPSRTFTGTLTITLTQANSVEGAVIRYTTNGTVPLLTSPEYKTPLTISTSQTIRARVFAPGLLPGETESRAYMLLDGNSSNFSSPLPVVLISNFGLGTPPDSGDQNGYMWVFEPGADGRTRLTSTPTLTTRIAMDRRGSSTLNNAKFNLNVETRMAGDNEDADVPLLGMPAGSDWVFSGPFEFDRTLLHNPFMYALSNAIGRKAMRTRMAEVFIDVDGGAVTYTGGASGNYFGVYNVMEKIRRGKDRVNIQNLREYDNTAPKVTGGYIVKVDRKDAGESGFSTPRESTSAGTEGLAYYDPKEVEILSPQRDPQEQYIRKFFIDFDNACFSGNFRDPVTGYAAYLDVDAAIDHHLLNVVPMNVDALRLSCFITKDPGGKLTYGPVWDFDRSMFAMNDGGRSDNPRVWSPPSGTDFFNYTWWRRLFSDLDFYQKYIDRFTNLRKREFSTAYLHNLIDEINASITDEAANRDVARWGKTKRTYTSSITGQSYTGQTAEIQRMKDWLQQRLVFMESQWVAPVTITPAEGNVPVGTAVTMSGPAGATIYYTTDGSDPRPSLGAAPSGSNVQTYTGTPIIVNATTRIRARAFKPSHTALVGGSNPPQISRWSGRTDARFSVDLPANTGNLIVTEINYHPTDPTADELAVNPRFSDADFEFLEVKNIGAVPIDLAGAQFKAGISFTFTGEQAISLAPGEIAIIAANPQAFEIRNGAKSNVFGPFQGDLSNGGERLLLVSAADETILDFTYDDAWYPESDGDGKSLVLYDQTAPAAAFSTADSWRASAAAGGTPGADDPPVVTTLAAAEIGATSVKLSATVGPRLTETTPEFVVANNRYPATSLPAGNTPLTVELPITGLSPHTVYTFHAEAANATGVGTGRELTFTTLNRMPDAQDKSLLHFGTREAFTINLLEEEDADEDGDALVISSITQGSHGTVTISEDAKSVLYTPAPEYNGNDSFTYTISDGFGGSDTAIVTLLNSLPSAGADSIVSNGEEVSFSPIANDLDADSADTLSIVAVTQGTAGTVAVTETGNITYTPGPAYFGHDTFTYTITDGSASASATVIVRNSQAMVLSGPFKGGQIPGQPAGSVYGNIDLSGSGIFSGEVKNGRQKKRAVFAADGSVLLKMGDPAPEISGATIAALGRPSGGAVVAKIKGAKGSGISAANDTVLYTGLNDGAVRIVARKGMTKLGGATLKSIVSVDGNGASVFFLAKLAGAGVKTANDLALCVAPADGDPRVLVREGDLVDGKRVVSVATLVSSKGTAAEGRWRSGGEAIGVRLSFSGKEQGLFTIPADATATDTWRPWSRTGEHYSGAGAVASFGLPGFGPDSVAFAAQLARGAASAPEVVTTATDSALLRVTADGNTLLAREGGSVPGSDGAALFGLRFQKFSDPVTGSDGRTAFAATLAGKGIKTTNRSGIWVADNSGVARLLARAGDQAPDGSRWAAFESLVFPDGVQSGPVFTAKLVADKLTPKNSRALWAVDSSGTLQRLLRTGQSVSMDGSTHVVKSFVALSAASGSAGTASGFDDDQHVSALVTFIDGSQALINIAVP